MSGEWICVVFQQNRRYSLGREALDIVSFIVVMLNEIIVVASRGEEVPSTCPGEVGQVGKGSIDAADP